MYAIPICPPYKGDSFKIIFGSSHDFTMCYRSKKNLSIGGNHLYTHCKSETKICKMFTTNLFISCIILMKSILNNWQTHHKWPWRLNIFPPPLALLAHTNPRTPHSTWTLFRSTFPFLIILWFSKSNENLEREFFFWVFFRVGSGAVSILSSIVTRYAS